MSILNIRISHDVGNNSRKCFVNSIVIDPSLKLCLPLLALTEERFNIVVL